MFKARRIYNMLKKIFALIFVCSVVVMDCFAEDSIPNSYSNFCEIEYKWSETFFIHLKENKKLIGRVEYNKDLKKYVSFAFFPFEIQYPMRRAVREFLIELTKYTKDLPGKYYIDMCSGEVGYYEVMDTPKWQPRDVYNIWPEIFRIVHNCTRTSTVMKTIQMFPPKERTHGDLTKMKKIKTSDSDYSDEVDLIGPGYSVKEGFTQIDEPDNNIWEFPTEEIVIDHEKIKADFLSLLNNTLSPYYQRLKQAWLSQDIEKIFQIASTMKQEDFKEQEICFRYAAICGHAQANYRVAENLFFQDWRGGEMLVYLRKAVEQEYPEAEFFLAQFLDRFEQGTPQEVFELFQRAVKHGYQYAEPALARCYWFGFGTKRNREKAFEMAKAYLEKYPEVHEKYSLDGWADSIAKMVAGLGYLKFTNEKTKGLQLLEDPQTELGYIVLNCVHFYGLYGVPQGLDLFPYVYNLQEHSYPHKIIFEDYQSKREFKLKQILEYQ